MEEYEYEPSDTTGVPLSYHEGYSVTGVPAKKYSWKGLLATTSILTLTGLAGKGEVLPSIAPFLRSLGLNILDWVAETFFARCIILLIAMIATGCLYYWTCSRIEQAYYDHPTLSKEPAHWKCQPTKKLSSELYQEEVFWGCFNAMWGTFLAGFMSVAHIHGTYTKMYFDGLEYGIIWYLLSFPVLFIWIECFAYWSHRFWHLKFVYKYFHKWHHRYQPPTAFSAVAFHPIEFAIYVLGGQVIYFFIPIHSTVSFFVGVYTAYYLIVDHSGIKSTPPWFWQPSTKFHDDHHRYFHCNFGQHLVWFDRMFNTVRRVNRSYGETVFGGAGARKGPYARREKSSK